MTVSTPLSTAIRFSTGNKIEVLITNPSHQPDAASILPKNYLTLHGKVETEINVGLGYLQVSLYFVHIKLYVHLNMYFYGIHVRSLRFSIVFIFPRRMLV